MGDDERVSQWADTSCSPGGKSCETAVTEGSREGEWQHLAFVYDLEKCLGEATRDLPGEDPGVENIMMMMIIILFNYYFFLKM